MESLFISAEDGSFVAFSLFDHPTPWNVPLLLLSTAGSVTSRCHSVPFSKSKVQEKVLIFCVRFPGAVQT